MPERFRYEWLIPQLLSTSNFPSKLGGAILFVPRSKLLHLLLLQL